MDFESDGQGGNGYGDYGGQTNDYNNDQQDVAQAQVIGDPMMESDEEYSGSEAPSAAQRRGSTPDRIKHDRGWCMCCTCMVCSFMGVIVKMAISIPLGGIVGLVATFIGNSYVSAGLRQLNDAFNDLGGNIDPVVERAFYFYISIAVVCGVVCLYGFRERMRIRNIEKCHHIHGAFGCLCCCGDYLIKFVITVCVGITIIMALIILSVSEVFLIFGFILHQICNVVDQVYNDTYRELINIIDQVGSDTDIERSNSGVEQLCSSLGNLYKSMISMWIGAAIVTLAQVVIVAYWFKYSTLTQVQDSSDKKRDYKRKHKKLKAQQKKEEEKQQDKVNQREAQVLEAEEMYDAENNIEMQTKNSQYNAPPPVIAPSGETVVFPPKVKVGTHQGSSNVQEEMGMGVGVDV